MRSDDPDVVEEGLRSLPCYADVCSTEVTVGINEVRLNNGVWRDCIPMRAMGRRMVQGLLHQSCKIADGLISDPIIPEESIADGSDLLIVHIHVPQSIFYLLYHGQYHTIVQLALRCRGGRR